MARDEDIRKNLGLRLAAARKLAGLTLERVAANLTEQGYKTGKAAVGAWEKGRNVPDSIILGRLGKMYGTTTDALLWDSAITMEAIRFAAQYDALNDRQQRAFKAMWLAYFAEAATDAKVGETIPVAPSAPEAGGRKRGMLPTHVGEGGGELPAAKRKAPRAIER